MLNLKTGLLRSPQPPDIRFATYLLPQALPPVPAVFGHYELIPPKGWGMLKNGGGGGIGDCAVAGPMHCSMLWNAISETQVRFTDLDAQDDYAAITGWSANDPSSDTGVDMLTAVKYWQAIGFRDSSNKRHKISAYLAVNPNNLDNVYEAAYLFDVVCLGVKLPASAMRQFQRGKPWSVVSRDQVEGFHFVPLVGRAANGNAVVITWGQAQEVQQNWLAANLEECVAVISPEAMVNGKSSEGFDMTALQDDLDAIGAA